jgi:hypothetical protein
MTTEGVGGSVHCDHAVAVENSKAKSTNNDIGKGDFFTAVTS